ncbi:hypothetical protein EH30_07140 [Erythrobacter sp. JL475]|nr:hypothetical protein EH30_07140 [Erythrobacter sp. JL475]
MAVFEAIYFHKKKIKTVSEIAERTGLDRKKVLTHGKHLENAGIVVQAKKDGETAYETISFFQHHKRTILSRRAVGAKAAPSDTIVKSSDSISRPKARRPKSKPKQVEPNYDVFISHASEDKKPFVQGLADRLKSEGIKVWYDKFTLKWGDSLRAQIDRGLASSRFGIVVLSPAFFRKQWPQAELDALFALEMSNQTKILPIWHNLSKEEVNKHSSLLAGRLALASDHPIEDLLMQLKDLLSE